MSENRALPVTTATHECVFCSRRLYIRFIMDEVGLDLTYLAVFQEMCFATSNFDEDDDTEA